MKHVALIHYRLLQRGGLERRLINYIDYFHTQGYRVTVFATKKDPKLQLPAGVEFERIKLGPIPKYFRTLFFARKVKQLMQRRSFDFSLSLGRTAGQEFVLDGGNHVGYMHCLGYQSHSLKDRINLWLDQQAFDGAKQVFACSGFVRDFNVRGYHTAEDRVQVIHPPLNEQQFNQNLRPQRAHYRQKYKLKETVSTFLFLSTGHKMKNLSFLLQVFEALVDEPYELLIAGTPPKRQLPPNVRYLGYVSTPEELYTAADYTIHPALYEPYGQVIAESLQCGTPVIISTNVGAKEVVGAQEGVIVDDFSVESWTREIRALANKTFYIAPEFATKRGLTLPQHMEKMLRFSRL